jgi:hypothetical protein
LLSYAKIRIRRRYVVFALLIIIETAFVVVCIRNSSLRPYLSFYQSQSLTASSPENQLDGFIYYRYDPNTGKLRFAVSCGTIISQNAPLGIFRTAAARTIEVQDLQLSFCENSGPSEKTVLPDNAPREETVQGRNNFGSVFSRLADTHSNWGLNMDLSNVIEITIDNFDCHMLDNDSNPHLVVRCRRATTNSNWPLVNLRGHVIITASDGATLESNHIIWDTRGQNFTAEGIYLLRRGENRIEGKNIRVDCNLNTLDIKIAKK